MKRYLIMGLAILPIVCHAQDESIKLESTFVGDKEQPSVSYFVPWQGLGTPDKLYRNIEGRHDQTLSAVDRDVLVRSIRIYNEMDLENSQLTNNQ